MIIENYRCADVFTKSCGSFFRLISIYRKRNANKKLMFSSISLINGAFLGSYLLQETLWIFIGNYLKERNLFLLLSFSFSLQ